jgi:hypothetical protein
MKSITIFFILRNYKAFLIIFFFFSFYLKIDIFKNNFYNFYNDNYYFCCESFSIEENLSGNIYNFLLNKNEYFKIIHNIFLVANFIISIFLIKRFELFFKKKLNYFNTFIFICIFILLPVLSNTSLKFQISIFGFLYLVLQCFKDRHNFFLIFLAAILVSLYPRLVLSLGFFIINVLIIYLYIKQKINIKFLIILTLSIMLVNFNYIIDLYNLFFFKSSNLPQFNNSEVLSHFYKQTNPYLYDYNNFYFFLYFFHLILSFSSLIYINSFNYISLDFLFPFFLFLLIQINFKKYKFYNLLFILNLFILSIIQISIYKSGLVELYVLFNPYLFIHSLYPLCLIILFLNLSLLKPKHIITYLLLFLFISHNYFKNIFDAKNLLPQCLTNAECTWHGYQKGGFFLNPKYTKLIDYLQKEKINSLYINKKGLDTKVYLKNNLYFYFPISFLTNNIDVASVESFKSQLVNVNKKTVILTILNDENMGSIYKKYLTKENCNSFFIIEDFFMCLLE